MAARLVKSGHRRIFGKIRENGYTVAVECELPFEPARKIVGVLASLCDGSIQFSGRLDDTSICESREHEIHSAASPINPKVCFLAGIEQARMKRVARTVFEVAGQNEHFPIPCSCCVVDKLKYTHESKIDQAAFDGEYP
ncbi:hypothetical protein [Pararobbsia alpina]|uniref:hypothetical protein n=1 Tax=Pararobbsia alpina TaxID=621374 RepID=UPI0015828289|nr:hypothetical protein [Pararobbsia alpina]